MDKSYKSGRLEAYSLLCMATVRQHEGSQNQDHITRFYYVLHDGLLSKDQVETLFQSLIFFMAVTQFAIVMERAERQL